MILGIDEVGRGPWAGPLVVGAVVLGDAQIEGLTDSKKLSAKRRNELAAIIHKKAACVGLGWVTAPELDKLGMSESLIEATKRAVAQITVPYHEIIIDGTINFLAGTRKGKYVTTLKKADLLIGSVSAASIVAKVARDQYMEEQALVYPEYGFESHVGYGTARHRAAIEKYGITHLHRLSFAPLVRYQMSAEISIKRTSDTSTNNVKLTTTKQIGDKAEDVVAAYLLKNGHEILERNWKTKFCEIDTVSQKEDTIYFTEVKYRKNDKAGGGIVTVTTKKHKQMKFAAELYMTRYKASDAQLIVAVVSEDFKINRLELLTD
jgi:ribonuclease HII